MPDALASRRAQIALALGTVYVVWGSTYFAIRVALESLPPFFMASARYLTAGVVLYAWAWSRGAERPKLVHWRSAFILGAALLLVGNGGVVWAEQQVSSGLAALLVSTEPLWIVLLVWSQQRQRPRLQVLGGMALGFTGLVLLLSPSAGGGVAAASAVALLCASASWASGSLYSVRAKLPDSPLLATAMQMLAGGALLLVTSASTGELGRIHPEAVSSRSLLAVVYLSVFGSIIAFTAYIWLLRAAAPVLVSTYAYVNPVVAVFLGWFAGHETIGRGTLLAAGVILGGVALIVGAPAVETPKAAAGWAEPPGDAVAPPVAGTPVMEIPAEELEPEDLYVSC